MRLTEEARLGAERLEAERQAQVCFDCIFFCLFLSTVFTEPLFSTAQALASQADVRPIPYLSILALLIFC